MEATKQGVIHLLKSAITGEAYPLPENFDLDKEYPALKVHHMDALLYEGAVRCGISRGTPVMRMLFQKYCQHLLVSEGQQRQVTRITAAFEENNIDYLPLKGCRMKSLYPKPELRYMGDADILIRMEQYGRVVSAMKELGFTEGPETNHEFHWDHPELNVELHKRLVSTFNTDFCAYYGDGWQRATEHTGHCWSMSPEEEWIFLFTHFAKHFRAGGIGCRYVVDLWVFLRTHPHMDDEYIRKAMEELQLLEFYGNIRDLIAVWFENRTLDQKTELMTDYIFNSGSWGGMESRLLSLSLRKTTTSTGSKNKLVFLWQTAFPDMLFMKKQYPVLKKVPWLLPVFWIYRLVRKLFFERGKIQKTKKNIDMLTSENLTAQKQLMDYFGIEIH